MTNDDRTQIVSPPGDAGRTQMMGNVAPLELICTPGRDKVLATRPNVEHLLVQLRSTGLSAGRRMPLNLALIIDRSGSMEGEPLEFVKRACAYVVDLMDPNDILSVVTFSESVDVVMPARRVVNKALIKENIGRIRTGNTTNLYDGIVAGCAQAVSARTDGYVTRALLLTDGEPTVGIKDYSSIVGQVGEQKSRGITLSALGFGPEYNEELLAGMARKTGGNYYYIARPDLIPEIFRKEMESLLSLVARNLKLRLNLTRFSQVRQIHGMSPTFGNRTAEVPLSDLERGNSLSALVDLELGTRPSGKYRVTRAEVIYDDCTTGQSNQHLMADAVMDFCTNPSEVSQAENPLVAEQLALAEASRNLEKTVMGIRTQMLTTAMATQELQKTQMLLVQHGRTDEAAQVGTALQGLNQGDAEKTLIGTIYDLDRGKQK